VNGLQKGVENALDHMCNSRDSVAVGISEWLYHGWSHSYPTGHCHYCRAGQSHPGAEAPLEGEKYNAVKYHSPESATN